MPDRGAFVLSEKTPKPFYAVAFDDMICVNDLGQFLHVGDMTADHNGCMGKIFSYQRAHFLDFADIGHDGPKPDDIVVIVLRHFLDLQIDDIATLLDIPVPTAKGRLRAATSRLQTQLEQTTGIDGVTP